MSKLRLSTQPPLPGGVALVWGKTTLLVTSLEGKKIKKLQNLGFFFPQ